MEDRIKQIFKSGLKYETVNTERIPWKSDFSTDQNKITYNTDFF